MKPHRLALAALLIAGCTASVPPPAPQPAPPKVAIEGIRARDLATGQIRGSPRVALVEQRGVSADTVIARVAKKLTEVGGDPFQSTAQCLVVEAKAMP
jgi:hypothetical protein